MKIIRYLSSLVLLFLLPLLTVVYGQNMLDENGKKTGPWSATYPDGKLRYEATFKDGNPVGLMKRYHSNGALSAKMNFSADSKRCYTKLYRDGKQVHAEGLYIDQDKDSVWQYFGTDGKVRLKETYSMGKLTGLSESYYTSGKISQQTMYENDKKHGSWKQFFESGQIMQSGTYASNKLHGPYTTYYPDGQIEVSGKYHQNLLDGDWNYYSEEGELKFVLKYIKGKIQNPEKLQEGYDKFIKHIEDNIGNMPDPANGGNQ